MKKNSQYQDKSVQEWATHLKYLQSILFKFDTELVFEKGTIICYFCKGLNLSLQVEIEQRDWELDNFKELVQKAVDVEAKAAFWPRSYICDID